MGTRADFYVGRGESAEWLGSIAMDGYPDGIPDAVKSARDESAFRVAVADFLDETDHATRVSDGWPWPWETSHTTDYAYAFDGGRVYGACFGYYWFNADEPEPEDDSDFSVKTCVFPTMDRSRFARAGTPRSGNFLIVSPEAPHA